MYDAGVCSLFNSDIPSSELSGLHRICADFMPNESYNDLIGRRAGPTLTERMAWFGPIQPGVLYGFGYNAPDQRTELKVMNETE